MQSTLKHLECCSCNHALTVASIKSTCGSGEGVLSSSGLNVGAVKPGQGISKTRAQQDSSMTYISQT